MTNESIETIRYSLKLFFDVSESTAHFSKIPDRIDCALKDMKRCELALAEFDNLVHFASQFGDEVSLYEEVK